MRYKATIEVVIDSTAYEGVRNAQDAKLLVEEMIENEAEWPDDIDIKVVEIE